MLDSASSVASFATQMAVQKNAQQVQLAALNKVQDLQKQQGEAVIRLMESAVIQVQSIDVYA